MYFVWVRDIGYGSACIDEGSWRAVWATEHPVLVSTPHRLGQSHTSASNSNSSSLRAFVSSGVGLSERTCSVHFALRSPVADMIEDRWRQPGPAGSADSSWISGQDLDEMEKDELAKDHEGYAEVLRAGASQIVAGRRRTLRLLIKHSRA
jgi:hypothetical protein